MFLVAGRCKEFGFVENAQEFRHLTDKIEESAESLDFLPCRLRRAGPLADEAHHVQSDFRQQLVEQLLAILKMIIKRALRYAGFLGDAGNGGLGVTEFSDDLGCGVENVSLGPCVALDAIEFCNFHGGCRCLRHALVSSSARSTRLSTLPEGLRGRLSRMMSCFGTLNGARRLRQ